MQLIDVIPDRPNLSEDLASALRERIVDGRLAAGERINEVHLSASLGVSRTPLREALARLVTEGSLECLPRRGFFVRDLTAREFRDLYAMRAILDPAALEQAGLPPAPTLSRLEQLNRRILTARGAERIISLDDEWHLELVGGCPNEVLKQEIRRFMARTRRYELAYMRLRRNVRTAAGEHGEILRALRGGNLKRACATLRRNMRSGNEPILRWLAAREESHDEA